MSKRKEAALLDKEGYCNYSAFMDPAIDLYFVMGHRGDGKTYGALDLVIDAYRSGEASAYVRREAEMITGKEAGLLFNPFTGADSRLEQATGGKYNNVVYRSKQFKPVLTDWDSGDTLATGSTILHTTALSTWETSKGQDRGFLRYIIFDEVITAGRYLPDEPFKWVNTLSSLMRTRSGTQIIMLANPLNQFCPYFDWYGIEIERFKPGTVADLKYDSGARLRFVWLPPTAEKLRPVNKILSINAKTDSVTRGTFDIKTYRHLPSGMYKQSEILYSIGIRFVRQTVRCDVCSAPAAGGLYMFFYPSDRFDDCLRIYDDAAGIWDSRHTSTFIRDTIGQEMLDLFRRGRDFYSTNSTGNIVENWIKNFIKKVAIV